MPLLQEVGVEFFKKSEKLNNCMDFPEHDGDSTVNRNGSTWYSIEKLSHEFG